MLPLVCTVCCVSPVCHLHLDPSHMPLSLSARPHAGDVEGIQHHRPPVRKQRGQPFFSCKFYLDFFPLFFVCFLLFCVVLFCFWTRLCSLQALITAIQHAVVTCGPVHPRAHTPNTINHISNAHTCETQTETGRHTDAHGRTCTCVCCRPPTSCATVWSPTWPIVAFSSREPVSTSLLPVCLPVCF